MEPRLREHRRLVKFAIDNVRCRSFGPVFEVLRIGLLDHAEAAEFFFRVIVVTVVILVRADETAAGNSVSRFRFDDAVNRKMKFRSPGSSG